MGSKLRYVSFVRAFIENGADVNQATSFLTTPLMIAVFQKEIDIVELLLCFGANPQLKNKKGMTAFDFAEAEKWTARLELLNNY